MAHEQTIHAYNKIADEYHYRNSAFLWQKEYEIFSNLLPKDSNIIEIGCGIGRDAEVLIKNYHYTGIDASKGMLEIAQKKVPSAKFQIMDFFHLEFPDNSFDGFWAAASLLHVPKDEIGISLQEIKRVLKEQAIGFISIKKKVIFDEGVIKQESLGIERYFSFYTIEEFADILKQNCFSVIQITEEIEDDKDKTNWICYFVKNS